MVEVTVRRRIKKIFEVLSLFYKIFKSMQVTAGKPKYDNHGEFDDFFRIKKLTGKKLR
jgi:hypothetical protein